jgi:hypothetical protein
VSVYLFVVYWLSGSKKERVVARLLVVYGLPPTLGGLDKPG